MKIIVPMAGMGKRMRPHTLTIPKPLIPVAGKPIVQHLVENIAKVSDEAIEEISYIIGDFGVEVENRLKAIAGKLNAECKIYYQTEPLGTAHAIQCAKQSLNGKIVVAFADTLFKADFKLDQSHDATIWVQQVANPQAFGIVKLNEYGLITDFIEKPEQPVSDLAIIGIYYFNEGEKLRDAIQYLLDNKITGNGEYQITDALENMKNDGLSFVPGQVEEWLDCGNKNATIHTNQRMLYFLKDEFLISETVHTKNSVIVPPCYIGKNVKIENAVVGPYVSIGDNSQIKNSVITNSILQNEVKISQKIIHNSMLGQFSEINGKAEDYSLSDYTKIR